MTKPALRAPHFKLVAQPNEWTKATRKTGAGDREPSEKGLRYKTFFESVLSLAMNKSPDPRRIPESALDTHRPDPRERGRRWSCGETTNATESRASCYAQFTLSAVVCFT